MKPKKKAITKKKTVTKKVSAKKEIDWFDKKEYKYLVDAVRRVKGESELKKVKGFNDMAINQAIEMTVEIEYHGLNKKDLLATWNNDTNIVEIFLDNLYEEY
jgi:hypothetical protein